MSDIDYSKDLPNTADLLMYARYKLENCLDLNDPQNEKLVEQLKVAEKQANEANKEPDTEALRLQNVMPRFSPNYKREKHPIVIRLLGIWRIITCRNFILIDFYETKIDGKDARKVRPLYRSDYDAESEFLSLKAALFLKMEAINGA